MFKHIKVRVIFASVMSCSGVILMSGCSVFGNQYSTPTIAVPDRLVSQPAIANQQESNLPELAWWRNFHDSQLNKLIESGLVSNNQLNVAMANLSAAKSQLTQVKLNWIPFISAYGGVSQLPALGNPGNFYGIWPQYTLNVFKQIAAQKQAKANLDYAQASKDSIRLVVIGQIAGSYFSYLAEQQQLKLYQVLENDLAQITKINDREMQVGLKSMLPTEEAKAPQDRVMATEDLLRYNIQFSLNSLSYLLNRNPGQLIISSKFDQLDNNSVHPNDFPINVINNRPDIKQAEANLQAANAGVNLASSNLLPSIQIDSFIGKNSIGGMPDDGFTLSEAYFNETFSPSVVAQIAAAKGNSRAAYFNYLDVVRKALKDIDNDFAAYTAYNKQFQDNQKVMLDLQQKYQLNLDLYNGKLGSYLQVLESKVEVDRMAIELNQNRLLQFMVITALYQDLAGGYSWDKIK